jgi:hypothetical protein
MKKAVPTLSALAGWEDAILASIGGATGTIEERDAQVQRSGIYAEYPAILACYLDRLVSEADHTEALKRAVFLVWWSAIEPPPLSGISELPERYARETMQTLESVALCGELDDEFRAMLAWYHSILAAPFDLFGAERYVPEAIRGLTRDAWRSQFHTSQFQQRGQLGRYWRSVLTTSGR